MKKSISKGERPFLVTAFNVLALLNGFGGVAGGMFLGNLTLFITGFVSCLFCMAIAEVIRLLDKVEANTRGMNEAVKLLYRIDTSTREAGRREDPFADERNS